MTASDDVDMEALRQKYSRPREQIVAEANAKYGGGAGASEAFQAATEAKMTDVIMCSQCQAHGTIKKQYGFRVLDEVRWRTCITSYCGH